MATTLYVADRTFLMATTAESSGGSFAQPEHYYLESGSKKKKEKVIGGVGSEVLPRPNSNHDLSSLFRVLRLVSVCDYIFCQDLIGGQPFVSHPSFVCVAVKFPPLMSLLLF
jgi:hypothetical protein